MKATSSAHRFHGIFSQNKIAKVAATSSCVSEVYTYRCTYTQFGSDEFLDVRIASLKTDYLSVTQMFSHLTVYFC